MVSEALMQQSQPGSQNLSAVPESGLQTSTTSLDVLCVQNPLLETVTFPSTYPPPPSPLLATTIVPTITPTIEAGVAFVNMTRGVSPTFMQEEVIPTSPTSFAKVMAKSLPTLVLLSPVQLQKPRQAATVALRHSS
jgi:hypothetical protein